MIESEVKVPEDINLECRVIAELLANPDLIPTSMEIITNNVFSHEKCKDAYSSLVRMYEEREPIDMVTFSPKVDKDFLVNKILAYDSYATDITIRPHCEALRLLAQRRKLYYSCLRGLQMSASSGTNEGDIVKFAYDISDEMEQDDPKNTTKTLAEAIGEYADELQQGVAKRVPSGLPIDKFTRGGFAQGQLVVLAARPSVGKTAFMLQMARCASDHGFSALLLSLEMTNSELSERMMFSTERIANSDITSDRVDWERFEIAAKEFDHSKIFLDENPQTLDEVCSSITRNNARGNCDIVFIDYLQLMSSANSNDSLYRQITEMTKRLKRLAKRLKIPVVLLAQLNRNMESEKRPPRLHDLRDSGSIEQDADIVVMLEKKPDESNIYSARIDMWLRKNRGGIGADLCFKMRSNQNYTRFYETIDEGQVSM